MPKRPKLTQQRRLQALQAAVEVISERGLADTRVADIAKRGGLSPALLLYYFGSKEVLLTEALTYAEDRFYLETFHELSEIQDPRLRLARLIALSCPAEGDEGLFGDWALWLELWARALRDPDASHKREALDRRWRNTIAEIVREGQIQGHFDTDRDPDRFALRLAALMDGLAVQLVLKDPSVTREEMLEICMEMATRQLGFDVPSGEPAMTVGRGRSTSKR